MIARLINPVSSAVFALVLALLTGPAWFLIQSDRLAALVVAGRRAETDAKVAVESERRAQGWDFWTIEMENLSTELKEEKKRLQQESTQLDQRAARLAADRQELERIRTDLQGMRHQIDERVIMIKADEAKNLRSLALTYSTLPATSAVNIIKEMDDVTVVKILSLMKPDVAGPLFDVMATSPTGPDGSSMAKRAAVLSEKLRLMKSGVAPAGSGTGS